MKVGFTERSIIPRKEEKQYHTLTDLLTFGQEFEKMKPALSTRGASTILPANALD